MGLGVAILAWLIPFEQVGPSPVKPDKFVQDYYDMLDDGDSDQAWGLLSGGFSDSSLSTGTGSFQRYTDWWDNIEQVSVEVTTVETRGDDLAVVCGTLHYERFDGAAINEDVCLYLVAEETSRSWKIERITSR
ncbi:MAG: hypothetical protein JXA14_19060 [Anaerolineae bacterium]|nr:hypothetical protein [Anaerolineae bacterium]